MMTVFLIFVGTLILAIWQGRLIRNLANCYSQPTPSWPEETPMPKAAIVLSLRGRDPFLVQGLRNLLHQDYPNFQMHIVVDSDIDPAWEAIDAIRSEAGSKLIVSTLKNPLNTCSLKNSSLIQAINGLPEDVEVVAMVDADAVVAPTWLRDLITPMADPNVGCSTGIRWFAPDELSMGTRLRCYWNHVAASVIYSAGIPWGGSMAIRRKILDAGLTDEWSRMFCEDAHTHNHLERHGYRLAYVPEATIPNKEDVTVSSCIQFINRQMLIFRLYSPNWIWLVMAVLASAGLRIAHDLLIVHSVWTNDVVTALLLMACHPIVLFVTRYEAGRLDQIVRDKAKSQGRPIASNPLPDLLGYFCVELVFLNSVLAAMFTRFATWRGIHYRIRSGEQIDLIEYKPYQQVTPIIAKSESSLV